MPGQLAGGQNPLSLFLPLAIAAVIILLRNSRPRKLKIERLWLIPVIYLGVLIAGLAAAPPPVSVVTIGVLVGGAVIGGLVGWQRGRFTRIEIDPATHEMTSRASVIGIAFIMAVLVARVGLRTALSQNVLGLALSPLVLADALLVLAVVMLTVQRLEIWLRASRMLAEARAGAATTDPSGIVQ
ncbi:MAG: DUF1453 family protein [Proteobacteria bacterium]|nr:DUF1453 family protein [Pseudomonadota bacterium]